MIDGLYTVHEIKQEPPGDEENDIMIEDRLRNDKQKHSKDHNDVKVEEICIDYQQSYECSNCSYRTEVYHNFKVHLDSCTGSIGQSNNSPTENFKADTCLKVFNVKSDLDDHVTKKHSDNDGDTAISADKATGAKKGSKFKCDICNRQFRWANSLYGHAASHSEERNFKCDICNIAFKRNVYLSRHMRKHTASGKEFKCKKCGIALMYPSGFRQHMRAHNGDFKCTVCDKVCSSDGSLRYHMVIHNAGTEKMMSKSECPICHRSFRFNSDLRRHQMTHIADKPFECALCPKKYAVESTLKTHIKNKHS